MFVSLKVRRCGEILSSTQLYSKSMDNAWTLQKVIDSHNKKALVTDRMILDGSIQNSLQLNHEVYSKIKEMTLLQVFIKKQQRILIKEEIGKMSIPIMRGL